MFCSYSYWSFFSMAIYPRDGLCQLPVIANYLPWLTLSGSQLSDLWPNANLCCSKARVARVAWPVMLADHYITGRKKVWLQTMKATAVAILYSSAAIELHFLPRWHRLYEWDWCLLTKMILAPGDILFDRVFCSSWIAEMILLPIQKLTCHLQSKLYSHHVNSLLN